MIVQHGYMSAVQRKREHTGRIETDHHSIAAIAFLRDSQFRFLCPRPQQSLTAEGYSADTELARTAGTDNSESCRFSSGADVEIDPP